MKLALKENHRKIKREKGNTIPQYLSGFTLCRDELWIVGIIVVEDYLIRQNTRDGTSSKHDDEESRALARKGKKGKGKKSQSKGDYDQVGKKKDLSKIKYFQCHELGHYAPNCLQKKLEKKPSGGATSEALASKFEYDFTLINKDHTFFKFCEFKELAEKYTTRKVKALRSDNGGEYVSNEFKKFCASKGIQRELTTPHNQQQNGVAERKKRSIVGVT
eukprot:PITA_28600